MQKVLWYFRQLFPLIYYSVYSEGNIKYFHIWRMWFGKVYNEDKFEIK
jgi:hypothetical protein